MRHRFRPRREVRDGQSWYDREVSEQYTPASLDLFHAFFAACVAAARARSVSALRCEVAADRLVRDAGLAEPGAYVEDIGNSLDLRDASRVLDALAAAASARGTATVEALTRDADEAVGRNDPARAQIVSALAAIGSKLHGLIHTALVAARLTTANAFAPTGATG